MLRTSETNKNLGVLKAGVVHRFDITLINDSDKEILFDTSVSCGCTKPKFKTNKVGPKSMIVGVCEFKPGNIKGNTTKSITFRYTDSQRQVGVNYPYNFSAIIN